MGASCCKSEPLLEQSVCVPAASVVVVEEAVAVPAKGHKLPLSPDDRNAAEPPEDFCWQIVSLANSHAISEDQRKGWELASRAPSPPTNALGYPSGSHWYLRIAKSKWQSRV
tara:strand:- start:27 stop:362 length:336 start_codon:yes stop_codon:yes gene_type:complete